MEDPKDELIKKYEEKLKQLSYNELKEKYLDNYTVENVEVNQNEKYQVSLEAVWDNKKDSDLRIFILVNDSSPESVRKPNTGSFIISPNGSFIGE